MTTKSRDKKQVRALQERTGWTYSECLRRVRELTPEAVEALVAMRVSPPVISTPGVVTLHVEQATTPHEVPLDMDELLGDDADGSPRSTMEKAR